MAVVSCRENRNENFYSGADEKNREIDYARGFEVEQGNNYRLLRVFDPWQGASNLTFQYVLVDHDIDLPENLPEGILVRTPVNSVICLSTTHIAMLDFIDETMKICAVAGSRYIFNEKLGKLAAEGKLPDIGYDMNLDYEKIIQLKPDVIFAYGVGAEANSYISRLQNLGIKVVILGEYLELSPLAQAEWVRFISHFFNRQELAEARFRMVNDEYNRLADLTRNITDRPVVMTGLPWRDSWFVPGGNSLFARLVSDAGGRYLWENKPGRENFPVSLEMVFTEASAADLWINTGSAMSMKDIGNTDSRLTAIPPFRNSSVYNNNARLNGSGGNDYWESGIVNPHLVLKDLINIIHPGLLDCRHLSYYRKL